MHREGPRRGIAMPPRGVLEGSPSKKTEFFLKITARGL